jgi:FlaG/FlaF family flagellin (archaellin)
VAVAVSFNAGLTDNYLNLAVSDGADPTAGWRVFSLSFLDNLPDYPSLASSGDKIVVTDNLFDGTLTPVGADLNTWTWSSILAGGSPTYNFCTSDGTRFNARAAQVLSPGNDVHLIMEAVPSGEQWYLRLTGVGACADLEDATDLTLFAPFSVPPAPRQLTGDTITQATDERPTDAIWQNGAMWWVSSFPWSYDGGATFNSVVVLWNVTTAATGSPTNPTAQAIAPGDGFDTFMGGIGMSRNGTLFTIYSQSSSTNFVYMMADQVPAGPGQSLGDPIQLEYGDGSATSERWGDFAGVAMDPVGTGTVWATHQVAAADGSWRTEVVRLVADGDSPTLPGALTATMVAPTTLGSSIPVKLTWAPSTDATSGVARYEIAQSIDGGAFGSVAPVAGTTTTRSLLINHTYRFEVRAVDTAGNAGAFRVGSTLRPYLYQQTSGTVYGGTWGSATSSSYSGGSARYAGTAGKSVTFTATSARSIGFVTTKAASRGSFKVYVDGVYKGAISTYSTTTKFRQLVYQFTWASPGTHKIKIVVVGTAGHPRVDVDAFVVLR